jgi:ATP-dependent Clp protease ATP-binding subunit ClpA
MFERYNEGARTVVLLSRSLASELGGAAIEPSHILLAILEADPALFRTWLPTDGDRQALRSLIEERICGGAPGELDAHNEDMRLASEAQQVLTLAAEEADRMQHAEIGPAHLLAGLLRVDTPAVRALRELSGAPKERGLVFVATSQAGAQGQTEAQDLVRLIEQLPKSQLGRARVLLQALVETERASRRT